MLARRPRAKGDHRLTSVFVGQHELCLFGLVCCWLFSRTRPSEALVDFLKGTLDHLEDDIAEKE